MSQTTLLNLESKAISPYWVDPFQPLQVPKNPLHAYAHKMQLLMERLENQSQTNPAQFNSTNYFRAVEKYTSLCEAINEGVTSVNEVLDTPGMAQDRDSGAAPTMGQGEASSLDFGVSPDNPLAG